MEISPPVDHCVQKATPPAVDIVQEKRETVKIFKNTRASQMAITEIALPFYRMYVAFCGCSVSF